MNILVGCECSQIVTKAFRAKGHNAYSCDILDCYGGHPEWHLKGDILDFISYPWDMLIAFPPCTYLSNASSVRMFPGSKLNYERYNKMLIARDFFLTLLNCDIPKICIENPVPMSICNLPEPSTFFQPWEYGHPYSKKTYLWLKNLPPLMPTILVKPEYSYVMCTSSQKKRSEFHPGVAAAMAEQWG